MNAIDKKEGVLSMNILDRKIKQIDSYICNLENCVAQGNEQEAKALQTEIIAVFSSEIEGLKTELDNYNLAHLYNQTTVDYIGDAKLLKAKLKNYRVNLVSGLYKPFRSSEGVVTVTQCVDQTMNITVTVDQVINNIHELPDTELSSEEKKFLVDNLAAISAEKDKQKRWSKICSALKWIADKGIQVGIAALPYIVKELE